MIENSKERGLMQCGRRGGLAEDAKEGLSVTYSKTKNLLRRQTVGVAFPQEEDETIIDG